MKRLIRVLAQSDLATSQELLDRACGYDNLLGLAQEKLYAPGARDLVAEPLGAFRGETLLGVACTSGRWLRLLAVAPEHRGEGVGTELLQACERQIAAHSSLVRTLDQPGNYLSPGIDMRNNASISWLKRRGYEPAANACNLLIGLENNPLVSQVRFATLRIRCERQGYRILRLPKERLETDAATIAEVFSQGWAFEMRRSQHICDGVHVAIEAATGVLAGFAAHDGNNAGRGWFGPTGILEPHRGRGLGAALLMACLLDVREAGHVRCQVAWIGPREFYDKIAGIESERLFTVMRKELT